MMKRMAFLAVMMLGGSHLLADGSPSVPLPGEPAMKPAISCSPFPDRLSAFVWRNWFLVPVERLARTVGASAADLKTLAVEMGLPAEPKVLPDWHRRGYITVLRRNWHLLDYDQLLVLLDMTREELRYRLVEDDFLFVKLGFLKPKCGRLAWQADAAKRGTEARRQIAVIVHDEELGDFSEVRRFDFCREWDADVSAVGAASRMALSGGSPFGVRMVYSYFAEYGDPLMDAEVSAYPEGLLRQLAAQGVNAVYLHVLLRTLSRDPQYPEFGDGSEMRLANLRKLVARAAKYGVKVFLYLNEPRSMGFDFFEKSPARMALKGVESARDGHVGQHALCTSVPEVRRWMRDSVERVFRVVPGLGGIYTISADENLTNCASHWNRMSCPRCATRTSAEIIAEANAALIEGMRRAAPEALAIVWDWGWPEADFEPIAERLPRGNTALMTVSEWGVPVSRGGVTTNVFEYSLSVAGPGERAKRRFAFARRLGFKAFAKVQAGCSWELASVPYLPVMDIVARHAKRLEAAGADGVLLSWTLGGYPSPNLSVFASGGRGESADATLNRLASERYGAAAVPAVRAAWTAFSDGFRAFPFFRQVLYEGNQHWGPANPLYPEPTGYDATMVGIPYDDLRHWRWVFSPDSLIAQFDATATGFADGVAKWEIAIGRMPAERQATARRERDLFEAIGLHFRSAADQARFVLAREADDRTALRTVVLRERATAKRYLALVRADPRLGFEASNHYFYVPQDVREKIVGCRLLLDRLSLKTHNEEK